MECRGSEGLEMSDLMISTYAIIRAAVNSLDVSERCGDLFMCEGGVELRTEGGEMGRLLTDMGGELLGKRRHVWLTRGLYEGVCDEVFDTCNNLPHHYQHPGVVAGGYPGHYQDGIKLIYKFFKKLM